MNCGNPADLAAPLDLTAGPADLAMVDVAVPIDLPKPVGEGGPCVPTNGGVEICDHIDNDCDGVTDNVNPDKLVGDPNNCGKCFNVCDYTAKHQFGACVGGWDGGMPMCIPSGCIPGYVNLNDPLNPGCNYKCTPTVPPTEICDGLDNDCDGKTDEPFGYPKYNTDINNCGGCGQVCSRQGAVAACKTDPVTGNGVCGVDHCINNGADTYRFNSGTAGGKTRDQLGCNYHCPFPSTTATTGSNDCDNTTCSFPPEVCNGIDDDCNFLVDDNPIDTGGMCGSSCPGGLVANCRGACTAGTLNCVSGVKICQGSTGPSPEICDGIDNDCDGMTDEPFGFPNYNTDPNNCGRCGNICNLAHAVNKCVTDVAIDATGKGVCEVAQCNAGFNYAPLSRAAGDPPTGTCTGGPPGPENGPTGVGCYYACPVNPAVPEVCDGKDNDCNGCIDDGLTPPASFCATQGVCAGRAIPVQCQGASGWRCNYMSVPNVDLDAMGNLTVTEKECDGLDNNCNGVTDLDGFPNKGQACTVGTGICQNSGTMVCNAAKTATVCSVTASPNNAVDEVCNGKDDDCDGQIDERTPVAGTTCYNGGAHPCNGWIDPMVHVTTVVPNIYVYEYEAARPDATAGSQGGNSSRACANPGVLPWSNVTETQAQAACAAVRDSTGAPMRLCTAVEWTAACEGPTPLPGNPLWSESIVRQNYVAGVCNDANQSATPAVWATGTQGAFGAGELCYTPWGGANRLYDMSGNVSEWTSTTVVNAGNTYYKTRGGTYATPSGGTTCEFDFDIFPATFANGDLGFRCCSNNAP